MRDSSSNEAFVEDELSGISTIPALGESVEEELSIICTPPDKGGSSEDDEDVEEDDSKR